MTTTDGSTAARKVFVVGSTGGVGRRLIPPLIAAGHEVTGLHRSPDSADAVRENGATPVLGDLAADPVERLTALLRGHDAVIFCAGAGGGSTVDQIDGAGPAKVAEAAQRAGVTRLLLVSVFMDAWRGDDSPGEGFERYMAAKRRADVAVAATDLDWLLVRPGTLTDDEGTGQITAGTAIAYGSIPRDDVAAFLVEAVFASHLNRVAVEITGGDTSVEQAVDQLRPRPAA